MLGLIAIRFPGETLAWDDKRMKFTNKSAANDFLHPAYRKGWKCNRASVAQTSESAVSRIS
jgi:hypothetical protein